MAYGNNRSGQQSRAHFQLVGGTTIVFKHPYLAGQLSSSNQTLDEMNVSKCCKMEGRFFEATPSQDSARQVVLIDGSTVTICNRLLNGVITMPVIRTTGTVATGDFLSALHLIKATGDDVGGLLYKTDYINGNAITKLFYGVTVKSVPDDITEGNDVGVYNVQLYYSGWIEAVSDSMSSNLKKIWAVGTTTGVEGHYSPYAGQNSEGKSGTGETPMTASNMGITDSKYVDDNTSADEGNVTPLTLTAGAKYTDVGVASSDSTSGVILEVKSEQTAESNPQQGDGTDTEKS